MLTGKNGNLMKQLIDSVNSHDIEQMLTLLTDDVIIEDIPLGMVMKGKDAVKLGYTSFIAATPDYKIEPKSGVTDDRSFAIEVILSGTLKGGFPGIPATGKRFSIRGCAFGEFENGKIKGRRDYWDSASLKK
jgi:steroid delta-isomerase-like uncharacterized protein